MKTLKAALLLVVMAPTLALATPRAGTLGVVESFQPIPSVAHEEGVTTNPTAAPNPIAAQAPAASAPGAGPAATTSTSITASEAAKEAATGFTLSADLDHWLGTGTFVNPNYYAYLAANLSVGLRYAFKVKSQILALSGSGRVTYEYTLPDNANGRRFAPWDTRFGISAPGLIKNEFTGISISPSFGFVIPTTLESWNAGLITSLSAGLSVAKAAGRFEFLLTSGGSRAFHTNPMNAIRAQSLAEQGKTRNAAGELTVLSRAGETLSDSAGMNTAWSVSVGGNVKLRVTDELSFSVGYTYLHYWRYQIPNDQYTPQAVDSNGNTVATAQGQLDRTFGVVAADYSLNDHFGISLSASTIQVPRSPGASGQAGYIRFPFWAVNNAASNATSVNFTFSASY